MNKLALLVAAAATVTTFGVAGAFAQAADNTFQKADANKDGGVTMEEAVAIFPTLTQDQFTKADANGDGKLDEGEYGSITGLMSGDNTQASSNAQSSSATTSSSSGG